MSQRNEITRRGILKRAVLIGGGLTIAATGVGTGRRVVESFLAERNSSRLLTERAKERPHDQRRWFTPDEAALVAALAAVIIPSDSTGPGANEAGVVDAINQMVAQAPILQKLYASGLVALDHIAQVHYDQEFVKLPSSRQTQLVALVDRARQALDRDPLSISEKAERKAHYWYYRHWLGITEPAMYLFGRLIIDVTNKFYSSQVAWEWLDYEGPPFPLGYIGRTDHCSLAKE